MASRAYFIVAMPAARYLRLLVSEATFQYNRPPIAAAEAHLRHARTLQLIAEGPQPAFIESAWRAVIMRRLAWLTNRASPLRCAPKRLPCRCLPSLVQAVVFRLTSWSGVAGLARYRGAGAAHGAPRRGHARGRRLRRERSPLRGRRRGSDTRRRRSRGDLLAPRHRPLHSAGKWLRTSRGSPRDHGDSASHPCAPRPAVQTHEVQDVSQALQVARHGPRVATCTLCIELDHLHAACYTDPAAPGCHRPCSHSHRTAISAVGR